MEDWSVDNPFGAITPYFLLVEGKWRLSAAIAGMFLCEYVTCPFCENQKGLTFESDSTRLGEMCDITCPKPCGREFQIVEITGYDLEQRLAYLAGEEADPTWVAKILAEDPEQPTGPLPPALDEAATPPSPPASGPAAPKTPRMRTPRRNSRVDNHGLIVGPGERVDGVRVTGGSGSAAREVTQKVAKTTAGEARSQPGARVYRNTGISNTGRMNSVSNTVVTGTNNQRIKARTDSRGSRVTVDGKPAPEGNKVPRKVAAKAQQAARDAQRQAERRTGESGGRSTSTVQIHGTNNSVITNTTDSDHGQSNPTD